ncbi:MAG: hypothetical protein WC866_00725 [Patescibacteria group bacterium]
MITRISRRFAKASVVALATLLTSTFSALAVTSIGTTWRAGITIWCCRCRPWMQPRNCACSLSLMAAQS